MPELIYHTPFEMNDGNPAQFTVGQSYEILAAFEYEDDVSLVVLNDTGNVHYFNLNCEELVLVNHFDMLGDYTDVWEERP